MTAGDAPGFQALRLRALSEHPEAFGAALADEQGLTNEQVAARLAAKDENDFILGAFVGDALGGMVSLARRDGQKRQHRATISGMYIAPEHRQLGLGRALMGEMIARARQIDGLEMLLLGVSGGNDAARRLYAASGFEPHYVDSQALKIDGKYVDLEWMRLVLR